ncbi:MAG: STAS domain-containing protein [Okeania sp. SIO1H5]|uniref:STAS domain-containing protein n=1 Tax=Okeania sp. SIO1H5 TaxID=2607777 RepID=UPI0013B63665|nr:STAS domain-containing protein [Okeania sp. SIO1H5]NET23740.1 STAS domain-containing protein [Okeania sp. SIO1H5]
MEINFREKENWRIMDISGHIKGNEVSQFRTAAQNSLKENRLNLVANMKDVGFIDSSGVGMLITCHQDLKAAGGKLVLMNLSDDIYDLFEMTSIDRLFEIVDSEEDLS